MKFFVDMVRHHSDNTQCSRTHIAISEQIWRRVQSTEEVYPTEECPPHRGGWQTHVLGSQAPRPPPFPVSASDSSSFLSAISQCDLVDLSFWDNFAQNTKVLVFPQSPPE